MIYQRLLQHTSLVVLAFFLLTSGWAQAQVPGSGDRQTFSGVLGDSASTFEQGKFIDAYPFDVQRGQEVVVTLISEAFDPYLIVDAPDGTRYENDDDGEGSNSRVTFLAREAGTWTARATTYREGDKGKYQLGIFLGPVADLKVWDGELTAEDEQSGKGEYYDVHSVQLEDGQRVRLEMTSEAFGPYLVLVSPSGMRMQTGPWWEAGPARAMLEFPVAEAGTWQLLATSDVAAAEGPYEISMVLTETSGDMELLQGELSDADPQFVKGEYYDVYTRRLEAGDRLVVEVRSTDFDTYLSVRDPSGALYQNDDVEDATAYRSVIDEMVGASGEWQFIVTSYAPGLVGRYQLTITLHRGAAE